MMASSQTLAHGIGKIEIRQRNRGRRQAENSENGKKEGGHEIKKSQRPNYCSYLPTTGIATPRSS